MTNFNYIYLIIISLVLISCTGATYQVARVDDALLNRAVNELNSNNVRDLGNTDSQYAMLKLSEIYEQLEPSATFMCRYLEERSVARCSNWDVNYSEDEGFNAYAADAQTVVIQKGVFDVAKADEEIAFILAHELGHHMLNHIEEERTNRRVGYFMGLVLSAAIAYNQTKDTTCRPGYVRIGNVVLPPNCDEVRRRTAERESDIMGIGTNLGTIVANLKYSSDQESEADLIAAYILSNSGMSLFRARPIMLELGRTDKAPGRRTNFFDTHPVGPERLAQFDQIIQEVLTNINRAPQN